jgi:hypothetical protein
MKTILNPLVEKKTHKFYKEKSSDFISKIVPDIKQIWFQESKDIVTIDHPITSHWDQMNDEQKQYYLNGNFKNAIANLQKKYKPSSTGQQTNNTSKFVMALHESFDQHIPFAISPEVIWAIVSGEVAIYIKNNSKDKNIRSLFTTSPNKQHIEVNFDHGDWKRVINTEFKNKLLENVPSEMLSLMTPNLTTSNELSDTVHMVSFMDAASKYYSYGLLTACGIPAIKIHGESSDWELIQNSLNEIAEKIPQLSLYANGLKPITKEFIDVLEGKKPNQDFWDSIYKINNGSGGPYSNGWFNNFYAHVFSYNNLFILKDQQEDYELNKKIFGGSKLEEFPSNLSVVDVDWNNNGTEHKMKFIGGIDSVVMDDEGYLTPTLGYSVVEV